MRLPFPFLLLVVATSTRFVEGIHQSPGPPILHVFQSNAPERQLRRTDWEWTYGPPPSESPAVKTTLNSKSISLPKLLFRSSIVALFVFCANLVVKPLGLATQRRIDDVFQQRPFQPTAQPKEAIAMPQPSTACRWSLCDLIQGFLVWRFAQSQSLSMGLLAFLFNLLFPILGPQHPTSYLYGWIACGFIEGLFADGDIVEADNGLSVDILVLTILWGCLKSFRLWRARGAASRSIVEIAKRRAEVPVANRRAINAPALMRIPAKIIADSTPIHTLYEMVGGTD
mmetsp:Transcript_4457/g.12554  ORF Transcript_4457/g.12554 Transcript_4457/m.12554 type:complete len:284 (-) Transcript_4457:845-1696(-)